MNHRLLSLDELTLKEKIAQLFVIGFRGHSLPEGSAVREMILEHPPGGVILFDRDMVTHKPVHNIKSPQQVQRLTEQLKEASSLPLFIGIDQEGGEINRLKPEYGFPATISHARLGQQDDLKASYSEGLKIAGILAQAGINLNFAPVVDLATAPDSTIIAGRERSFGADPLKVTVHARAYIQGHQDHHILTCCKHFPGHGSAKGDTHAGFVDVSATWTKAELEPYRALIDSGECSMIMTAHLFNKHLDAENPATLSTKTIQNLLREELGFEGVVISDDMQMKAISDHYSLQKSLELGLKAGVDLFCFGNNLLSEQVALADAIAMIERLLDDEVISESRLDASVRRILNLKNKFLLLV